MDKPVFENERELEELLRIAIAGAKNPYSLARISELSTRYQVSLVVVLPRVERHDPSGGLDLWRLLNDLETFTAKGFRVHAIAFPTMEIEITGWVNSKPDEVGTEELGYLISIQEENA